MSERTYTFTDLERMREALKRLRKNELGIPMGNGLKQMGPTMSSNQADNRHNQLEWAAHERAWLLRIEDELRTCIAAGVSPEEIEARLDAS